MIAHQNTYVLVCPCMNVEVRRQPKLYISLISFSSSLLSSLSLSLPSSLLLSPPSHPVHLLFLQASHVYEPTMTFQATVRTYTSWMSVVARGGYQCLPNQLFTFYFLGRIYPWTCISFFSYNEWPAKELQGYIFSAIEIKFPHFQNLFFILWIKIELQPARKLEGVCRLPTNLLLNHR